LILLEKTPRKLLLYVQNPRLKVSLGNRILRSLKNLAPLL
jgi:hypothetical protein